jgi:hypothetical protein
MKTIKLTSANDGVIIYINIQQIGHFYHNKTKNNTTVGVTTHNNGGFSVTETADEIQKMIRQLY